MNSLDRAGAMRRGEELDAKTVASYLREHIPGLQGEMVLKQFPSGHSNLTYLVAFGDRELVLRRPPFGRKAKSAHDMGREYRILSALTSVYPYCPKPLVYTEDPAVMGCPFYVMERIKGIILRKDLPPGLALSPAQLGELCRTLLRVQFELHSVDYRAAGLDKIGKPAGYVKRQVDGWSGRYRAARTPDAPAFEGVMEWLAKEMPGDAKQPAVIHNDFKFDNVILDPADPMKIIGVLDWEMATLGDPLMDLGSSLAYWVQKDDPEEMRFLRFSPTHLDGALTRQELVDCYAELSGRSIDNFVFYYAFGLFRLAVIIQQIYYRYYHGQTQDERFKGFVFGVGILERAAQRVIETQSL